MTYRAIQDTVAYSSSLNALTAPAERLYWRLLAHSDSHGRLPGTIEKVRARCIPIVKPRPTDDQIEAWLGELSAVGRVQRYTVDGADYVQILEFDANQPPEYLRRRGASKYPSAPESVRSDPERLRPEVELEVEELPAPSEPRREAPTNGTLEACVQAVYGYWREQRGRANRRYDRISVKRREKIVTRLRKFSAEDLCRAIDGIALDPWPERPRHDDLTIVLRSDEQVEKFLELAERPDLQRSSHPRGVSPDDVMRIAESME